MSIRVEALPELVQAMSALADEAAGYGIAFDVADYGGTRTQADTAEILAFRDADYAVYRANGGTLSESQFRPIAPWLKSFHDFGAARDLRITGKPAGWSDDDAYAQLGELAPGLGLRWGGNFSNPDPDHFELAIPLAQAAAAWNSYTGGTGAAPANVDGKALGALALIGVAAWLLVRFVGRA